MSEKQAFKNRAVFLDRDGTIVKAVKRKEFPFPTAPWSLKELVFEPRVEQALRLFKKMGFLRIMATNQPDVAYGKISPGRWRQIQEKIECLGFDDVFMCRHRKDDDFECPLRKPNPGMLIAAADKHGIDLKNSWMIGDRDTDLLAAEAAGCRGILIETIYNKDVYSKHICQNLWGAAQLIKQYN